MTPKNEKKIPLRKCIGCNDMRPKAVLLRIVRSPARDQFSLDPAGKQNGRGAYLCVRPECLKIARKRRALEHSFQCKIDPVCYEMLEQEIERASRA